MQRWISFTLQAALGTVFAVSALTKLYPIEPVELYIYSLGIFPWSVNEMAVRLLIIGELSLGLLLLTYVYRRVTLGITLGVLVSMSLFLLYTALWGQNENCHCFGEVLPMTPLESLGKNAALIAIAAYLFVRGYRASHPYQDYIAPCMPIAATVFVLTVNGPDSWISRDKLDRPIDNTRFAAQYLPDSLQADAVTGKRIMCFFSTRCKYCVMAANKLSLIQQRYGQDAGIRYFFFGSEDMLSYFWIQSKSIKYPWYILSTDDFFSISDNRMPTIFLVDNGKIVGKFGYRGLNEEIILDFLNEPAP